MNRVNIFSLIKIGSKEFMKDLYENGVIYMNHISEFVKIEDGNVRGDVYEHLYEQQEMNNVIISLNGKDIACADKGKLQIWNEEMIGNIYCMYMLETIDNIEELIIDSKCKDFGDTAIVILKVDQFYKRIKEAIESKGLKMHYGPVEYIEVENYFSKWSLFKKPLQYKYQNEFRFVVKRNDDNPLVINIGSLKDIAVMIESEKLDQLRFSRI